MDAPSSTLPRDAMRSEQSFPLISFVQLSTYCVALVTCIDFKKLRGQIDTLPNVDLSQVLALPVASTVLGFLIGASVGLGQIRKWRSFLLCGTVGAVVGPLILSAFAAPAEPLQACFACALPLLSTLILRFRTR